MTIISFFDENLLWKENNVSPTSGTVPQLYQQNFQDKNIFLLHKHCINIIWTYVYQIWNRTLSSHLRVYIQTNVYMWEKNTVVETNATIQF